MAELPDQGPAATGHGGLRASRADRERVTGTLKAAFVQGHLDQDEFGLRVDQVLASRTYAELAVITADLPAGLTDDAPSRPARPASPPGRRASGACCGPAGWWRRPPRFTWPCGRWRCC